MFLKFECVLIKDYIVVKKWQAEFESIRIYKDHFEVVILSQKTIHVIIGESFRGRFVSLPDFKVSCLIYNYRERFENFDNLSKVLTDIDAATVESALFYIGKQIIKG